MILSPSRDTTLPVRFLRSPSTTSTTSPGWRAGAAASRDPVPTGERWKEGEGKGGREGGREGKKEE